MSTVHSIVITYSFASAVQACSPQKSIDVVNGIDLVDVFVEVSAENISRMWSIESGDFLEDCEW